MYLQSARNALGKVRPLCVKIIVQTASSVKLKFINAINFPYMVTSGVHLVFHAELRYMRRVKFFIA